MEVRSSVYRGRHSQAKFSPPLTPKGWQDKSGWTSSAIFSVSIRSGSIFSTRHLPPRKFEILKTARRPEGGLYK